MCLLFCTEPAEEGGGAEVREISFKVQAPATPPQTPPALQDCHPSTPPPDSPGGASLLDLYNRSSPSQRSRESSAEPEPEADPEAASQHGGHVDDDEDDDEQLTPRPSVSTKQLRFTAEPEEIEDRQITPPSRQSSLKLHSGAVATSLRRQQQQQPAQQLQAAFVPLSQPATSAERHPFSPGLRSTRSVPSLRAMSPPSTYPSPSAGPQAGMQHNWMTHGAGLRGRESVSTMATNTTTTTTDAEGHSERSTPQSMHFPAVPPLHLTDRKLPSSRRTMESDRSPVVETKRGAFEMMMPAANDSAQTLDPNQRVSLWSDTTSLDVPVPSTTTTTSRAAARSRASRRASAEAEAATLHREKEAVWLHLFKKYDHAERAPASKVLKHCKTGIPSSVRFKAWVFLSHADIQPDRVHNLLSLPETSPSEHAMIEDDLVRVYAQHPLFRTKATAPKHDVALIMHGLSQQKPGQYRTSLVYLVNGVLQFATPEQAFCLISTIVGAKLPLLYGPQASSGSLVYILRELLRKQDAQLLARFQEDDGGLGQLITLWLAPLFLNGVLPAESALRVLDIALCEGERFLFSVAFAMLDLMRDLLLDKSLSLRRLLEKPPEDLVEPTMLFNTAFTVKIKTSSVEKLARQSFQHRA